MHTRTFSNRTFSSLGAAAVAAAGLAASAPGFAATTLPFDATVYLSGAGASPVGRCAPDLTISNLNMTKTHSNLGSFVFNMSECITPPPPTTTYGGQFSFEFANGAFGGTSYSIISSTAQPGIFNLDGEYTITHGSGDFKGATGVLVSRGQLDRRLFPPDATAVLTLVGSVSMVPEPATYGLMLAGFGVVGFAARRRSRTGDAGGGIRGPSERV
jgi:hypothetical protein